MVPLASCSVGAQLEGGVFPATFAGMGRTGGFLYSVSALPASADPGVTAVNGQLDGGSASSTSACPRAAALLHRLPKLFEERRFDLAAQCLDEVEACQQHPSGALVAVAAEVRRQAKRVKEVRGAFDGDGGWIPRSIAYGFQVYTKGSGAYGEMLSVRVEGTVDAPLLDLLALLHEVDLWTTWVPKLIGMGLRAATIVVEASPLQPIIHATFHLPWPFSDRDTVLAAEVVDCMDGVGACSRQQIVILLDSDEARTHFPSECVARIPDSGPNKRVDLVGSALVLTPVKAVGAVDDGATEPTVFGLASDRTQLQVLMCGRVDLSLPSWLLNVGIDTMTCLVLYCVCRQAARICQMPAYQERLESPDGRFYEVLRPRLGAAGRKHEAETALGA